MIGYYILNDRFSVRFKKLPKSPSLNITRVDQGTIEVEDNGIVYFFFTCQMAQQKMLFVLLQLIAANPVRGLHA